MIKTEVVTVADEPTLLSTGGDSDREVGRSVSVRNASGVSVFVGGDDVDTDNGWEIADGEDFGADLMSTDALYGIVATGTADVTVMQTGV